jgi:hypothetical protein
MEPKVGGGSSRGPTKQLEFSPKSEPVIRIYTKNIFSQPPSFGDIEENTRGKVVLPHCGELFKNIIWEEFPEYNPHNDPDMRKIDDDFFFSKYLTIMLAHGSEKDPNVPLYITTTMDHQPNRHTKVIDHR